MHVAIADKKEELAAVCRRYGVTRLDVFGSAAHGHGFRSTDQRRRLSGGIRPRQRPGRRSTSSSTLPKL